MDLLGLWVLLHIDQSEHHEHEPILKPQCPKKENITAIEEEIIILLYLIQDNLSSITELLTKGMASFSNISKEKSDDKQLSHKSL